MIKKILKVLLILFMLVAVGFLSLFSCLFFRISLWWSLLIYAAILGGYFITKWVINRFRIYIRKRKAQAGISQEDSDDNTLEASFDLALMHSKKYKKTYKRQLPWFLLLGANETGKSSLIGGSKVYSFSENIDPAAEITGTKSARCWALDDSVIAEVSGSLFSAKPSRIANRAWKKIVSKIKAHRRYVQVKGLVATVSVEQLFGDADELIYYAQSLRQKVEHFSKQSGYSYPIYLMITKSDHLQGFESFALGLPDELYQQPFGRLFSQQEYHSTPESMIETWLSCLSSRIMGFNTVQLQTNGTLRPRALLLNNNLSLLKKPLIKFLDAFYKVSAPHKQDNPVIRGVFLTSAKQDNDNNDLDSGTVLEGLSLDRRPRHGVFGLFVQHIFSNILPKDFDLKSKFSAKIARRQRAYKQAIIGWWVIFIGGSVYLGVAYTHAIKALNEIEQASITKDQQFTSKLNDNLLLMSSKYQDLLTIKNIKENWFFSIWPYDYAFDRIIEEYKHHYVFLFDKYVLGDLHQALAKSADLVTKEKHKQNFGFVVQNIVQRINLIQARLDLMPDSKIQQIKSQTLLINDNFKSNDYGILYKKYVIWNNNLIALKKQRGQLLKLLDSLNLFDKPFKWLDSWVNQTSEVSPIKASSFWPMNDFMNQEPTIKPVYTQKGYKRIKALLHNIANVQLQPTEVEQYSLQFFADYDLKRYKAWRKFTDSFRTDVEYLPSEAAWYATTQLKMTETPYHHYATVLTNNFTEPMLIDRPEWLELYFKLAAYFKKSIDELLTEAKQSWWQKLNSYMNLYARRFQSDIKGQNLNKRLYKAVNNYQKSIIKLEQYALKLNNKSSFESVSSLFSSGSSAHVDINKHKGKFYKTYNAFQQIKYFATDNFNLINDNQATWNLFKGHFDLIFHGVKEKAQCHINHIWNQEILDNAVNNSLTSTYSLKELFGSDTKYSKFMTKYLYPFLEYKESKYSYVPKSVFGHTLKFSPFVYKFVNHQYEYTQLNLLQKRIQNILNNSTEVIKIKIAPTNVNKHAKLLPDATSIKLKCSDKTNTYTNYDMVSQFALTSDIFKCSSAELNIDFKGANDFTATKTYKNESGLIDLINDFSSNNKITFKASDFPEVYNQLQQYNISEITVFITFTNLADTQSLLSQYAKKKAKLVKAVYGGLGNWQYLDITECWSHKIKQNKNNVLPSALSSSQDNDSKQHSASQQKHSLDKQQGDSHKGGAK